jgi:M6 family metalloprotease-like protein
MSRVVSVILILFIALASRAYAQDVRIIAQRHGTTLPNWIEQKLAANPDTFEFQRAWYPALLRVRDRRGILARAGLQPDSVQPFRAAAQGTAVAGVLRIPVFPILYANTLNQPFPSADLERRLFTAGGDTLTITRLYRQLSRNVFRIDGRVYDWVKVPNDDSYYEGGDNGKPPFLGRLLKAVLDSVDRSVDFRAYDRNSDGFVDVVAFVQPESGGECGTPNIWSLRWTYGAANGDESLRYRTNDGVYISDFVIQPAFDCDEKSLIEIGVFGHEFGHALGLPDLYSTSDPPANAGVGFWGLMGAGNWNLPASPAHLEAWSKTELGWVPLMRVRRDTTITIAPAEDSGFVVRVDIPHRRGEYFLLENRQPIGSDTNLLGTGLLIWHVDSMEIARRSLGNTVQNNTIRKGVDLEEADGQNDLDVGSGIADSGDPFPGTSHRSVFGPLTSPNSNANDGSPSGIRISGIQQVGRDIQVSVAFNSPGAPMPVGNGSVSSVDTTGPTALITFRDAVRLSDIQWLESRDYTIVQGLWETNSVLVKLPANLTYDPRRSLTRIRGFAVQQH